jgi:hypothetical protein
MLLALCLASLLGSTTLVEAAARQPFGPRRDLLLSGANRIDQIAATMRLDRPADWVQAVRAGDAGRMALPMMVQRASAAEPWDSKVLSAESAAESPAAAFAPIPLDSGSAVVMSPLSESPPSQPPSAPAPLRRQASAESPLRVHVIGDSFAEPLGLELQRLQSTGVPIVVSMDARIATALTRPDYFDWPARVAETLQLRSPMVDGAAGSAVPAPMVDGAAGSANPDSGVALAGVARELPEILVVVFAGNEGQNMFVDGELLLTGSPEWASEYQLRAAALMDLAGQAGVEIYWIGLPPMRDEPLAAAAREINRVLAESAEARPWVQMVETWSMFVGLDGAFEMHVQDARGEAYQARRQDGVHWTRTATDQVAARALEVVAADWGWAGASGVAGADGAATSVSGTEPGEPRSIQ